MPAAPAGLRCAELGRDGLETGAREGGEAVDVDYAPDHEPRAATEHIFAWWAERWLAGRVERKDILERVEQHNFIHPIRHGARVPLLEDPRQFGLFEEW